MIMILIIMQAFFIERKNHKSSNVLWGQWLQNRLQADDNELRSPSAFDIQRQQCGCFCIVSVMIVVPRAILQSPFPPLLDTAGDICLRKTYNKKCLVNI